MKRTTIVFKDKGQPFKEWVINENQIVVDSRPFGKGVWKGTKVIELMIGAKPVIKTPYQDAERQLNYVVLDLKVEEEYEESQRIVDLSLERVGELSFGDSIRKFGHRL